MVEGDLFTSSNERKYLGFQLFTILLPHLRCACAQCSPPWCKWRAFRHMAPACCTVKHVSKHGRRQYIT